MAETTKTENKAVTVEIIVEVLRAQGRNYVVEAIPQRVTIEEAEAVIPGFTSQFALPPQPNPDDCYDEKQYKRELARWERIRDGMPKEVDLKRPLGRTARPSGIYIVAGTAINRSAILLDNGDDAPWVEEWRGPFRTIDDAKAAMRAKPIEAKVASWGEEIDEALATS